MSWHHPDLYFFLFLLAGLTAFLAIIYKCIQKLRRRESPVVLPLDGLQLDRPVRQPMKGQASGGAISVGSRRALRTSRRRSK